MAKEEIVWVSQAFMDTTLMKSFVSEQVLTNLQVAGAVTKKNTQGVWQPQSNFPAEIFGKYPDKKMKLQPDIFYGPCGLIVSDAVAEVMNEAQLGQTALYPVDVLQHDRKTKVEGAYKILALAEQKRVLMPEQSDCLEKWHDHIGDYSIFGKLKDFDLVVSQKALEGPELWVDPLLVNSLFLTDRLAKALKKAKVTRRFGLRKCRVVDI